MYLVALITQMDGYVVTKNIEHLSGFDEEGMI